MKLLDSDTEHSCRKCRGEIKKEGGVEKLKQGTETTFDLEESQPY